MVTVGKYVTGANRPMAPGWFRSIASTPTGLRRPPKSRKRVLVDGLTLVTRDALAIRAMCRRRADLNARKPGSPAAGGRAQEATTAANAR